ncbi:MAG: DegT/DnrJ/EryC1/StrS family aminotransferase [Winogradskyella sp.]|uniref:DegT/DnrJ/EryC1/StrS family aminotransferase n=1 Tax=Winogradskyella sp. TaxID=1883156 RepID=UPI0026007D4C|nr:DegT/DnrJ/EryC1/StrS family aminotransferase [Winogradskyella sp.]NRB61255.1 DegT/DnrJ/EryC1/StrS family aminotransferase [Winogradskyella sp.]
MITFLDLHKINDRFRSEFEDALQKSLDTSHFVLGKNVLHFQNEFARYCGTKHCIGVANGLDALTLILKGYIQLGKLKKGDKIIVPANTFIATILSVLHAGLEPVFVEPNPETYNLSADTVTKYLSKDVKALIVVHLYGQLADVLGLKKLAEANNLLLIEDAAQAHGAKDNSNNKAGNIGDAAAFSFYPSKNLGCLGDGGAVTTSDSELYEVIKLLSNYGSNKKYVNDIVGFNSRLDDIQASFLSIKLNTLDEDNRRRREIAREYLRDIDNPKIMISNHSQDENHVFYAFVVEVEDREEFSQYLTKNNIGWLIHYPIPPHKQKALSEYSNLSLPFTEQIHKRILSLPISPVMTEVEVKTVVEVVNRY